MEYPMPYIYGTFLLLIFVLPIMEMKDLSLLKYSKFRKEKGISSVAGMFFLYFVPILACLYFSWDYIFSAELTQLIIVSAIILHFGKRCLESLFLHKYSGPIDLVTVMFIMGIYSAVAALTGWLTKTAPVLDWLFVAGGVLFLFSEAANFWHHKILADLRENREGYFIPAGGFFNSLTCPHYFFEVLAWIGVAMMSHQVAMILVMIAMHNYLAARAYKTREWYVEKFDDFPTDRKLILPGIL
jgi:very-long-chain enoyl-CoA reductase